ncbi:MAG: hypothetical protein CVT67_09325 [Actinobacteria bacterium HGW-Actinobacteria-7]|nr:MAG: hypothetical protein CVT67_09325 [Actinobacteria bacterium HGW-Actinobacteria-7]
MRPTREPIPRGASALLLFALLVVLAGGRWFFQSQALQERAQVQDRLEAISKLKVNEIQAWREDQIADAELLITSPAVGRDLVEWSTQTSVEPSDDLREFLRFYEENNALDGVFLVRADGSRYWSLGGAKHDLNELLPTLATATQRSTPVMTDLHVESGGTELHVNVLAPISGAGSMGAGSLSAVVLVTKASNFLYPVLSQWPTPSKSGESVLIQAGDGDVVVFRPATTPGAYEALRLPAERREAIEVAASGTQGPVRGSDLDGVAVVAFVQKVPGTDWVVVSKIDESEAFAGWRVRGALIIASVVILVLLVAVAWLVAWEGNRRAHYRALYLAEVENQASAQRYRITLDAIGDAVIATDSIGRVTLINPIAEALCGWHRDDAVGRPISEVLVLLDDESRAALPNPVERVLEDGVAADIGTRAVLVARNGAERPIADSCSPIRDIDGAITGAVLVFRDQTEERVLGQMNQVRLQLAEFAATHSLNELRAATVEKVGGLVASPTGFFGLVSADHDVADWPLMPEESSAGVSSHQDFQRDPIFADCLRLREPITRNNVVAGTMRALVVPVVKDDEIVAVLGVAGKPSDYTNNDREAVSSIAVAMWSLVEEKRSEELTTLLEANLAQAQKMESVGRLAGGVAHDFNNMLGVILGHAEMAMERLDAADPLLGELREIQAAAERSAALTRQLLAFARRQTIVPRVLDLNGVIEQALTMLRRLIGENVSVTWAPAPDLWRVRVDPVQIDQVLTNLCVNARDAISGTGEITIETQNVVVDDAYCSVRPECRPGEYVVLSVSDDGSGMDATVLPHVFEPFYTTKNAAEGTGLGLATVHGIVSQNNGIVSVYSEPGLGTTFRVYLPHEMGELGEEPARSIERMASGEGRTILLVEDEIAILTTTVAMLERQGYRVIAASGPEEALAIAAAHEEVIELLVTDVVMPHMNGRDLAAAVKLIHPESKCLFMSGYTADVIAHKGVLEEGVQFVAKPFSLRQLATAVGKALDSEAVGEDYGADVAAGPPAAVRIVHGEDSSPVVGQSTRSHVANSTTLEASNGPAESDEEAATILVVEDEPSLLYFARFVLEKRGYRVLGASLPSEALALAEAHPEIALVFTDITLPEMSGIELVKRVCTQRPEIRVLFASGHSQEMLDQEDACGRRVCFLHKPYSIEALELAIEDALVHT